MRRRTHAPALRRGGRDRRVPRLRHRRAEHRLAHREPEPAAPRVSERGSSAATPRKRLLRPGLGGLGLHASHRSVGELAPRAASHPPRRRPALRDHPRPRPVRGVGEGSARRAAWTTRGTTGGGPGRNERAQLRTRLGRGRADGLPFGVVDPRALGAGVRRRIGRGARSHAGAGVERPGGRGAPQARDPDHGRGARADRPVRRAGDRGAPAQRPPASSRVADGARRCRLAAVTSRSEVGG